MCKCHCCTEAPSPAFLCAVCHLHTTATSSQSLPLTEVKEYLQSLKSSWWQSKRLLEHLRQPSSPFLSLHNESCFFLTWKHLIFLQCFASNRVSWQIVLTCLDWLCLDLFLHRLSAQQNLNCYMIPSSLPNLQWEYTGMAPKFYPPTIMGFQISS